MTYHSPNATAGEPVYVLVGFSTNCPGPNYFCTVEVNVSYGDGQFDSTLAYSDQTPYTFEFAHIYGFASTFALAWSALVSHYWNGTYANQSYAGSAPVVVQPVPAPGWTPLLATGIFGGLVAVAVGYLLLPRTPAEEVSAARFVGDHEQSKEKGR